MARIGASLNGIERSLLNRLATADAAASLSVMRMATGRRINSPADDPSAFIALASLQSNLNNVSATMSNVTAAASIVGQTKTAISGIGTQLNAIRTELLKDEGRSLSAAEREESQAKIDAAITTIRAYVDTDIDGRKPLNGSADYLISGRNSSQVSSLSVYSTGAAGPVVAATPAQATYTGDSRYVDAAATIRISGADGTSTAISVTTDDTLEELAGLINLQTSTTGVAASVDDNTLTLASTATGAGSRVRVTVDAGTFDVEGTGSDGVARGTSVQYGTAPAVSGRVTRAATQAQLSYTGSGSNPTHDATVSITGSRGSAAVTVETTDTIDEVAQSFNDVSHDTGITASVATQGANEVITFASVDYGYDAEISLTVTSGTFATGGGNGDGTANGSDVEAVVNGVTYSGSTAPEAAELRHREKGANFAVNGTFELTGHIGTQTYSALTTKSLDELAAEINVQSDLTGVAATVDDNDLVLTSTITGTAATVSINVTAGSFDTVDGETSSQGTAATEGDNAVKGNRVTVDNALYRFSIEFASDFSGNFNPMTIEGDALTFALSTDTSRRSTLSFSSLAPEFLGGVSGTLDQLYSGGDYSGLDDKTAIALRIVDEAMSDVDRAGGRVEGFYNAQISSASSLLSDMEDDLQDSIDQTDGYNQEEEEVLLARNLDLGNNALAGLAILNQQRSSIVTLIQQIAGLS